MFYYKLLQFIYAPLVWIFSKTKFYNSENVIKDQKVIYVCNHTSYYDAVIFFTKYFRKNKINVIAKAEVYSKMFKGKFMHKAMRNSGVIPMHRGEPDIENIKSVISVINQNEPLFMFPEGTRNKGDLRELLEIKNGAALFAIKTGAPIIPVMYSSRTGFFKKSCCNVGKPFYLDQFNGKANKNNLVDATKIIESKMKETQKELFDILDKEKKD